MKGESILMRGKCLKESHDYVFINDPMNVSYHHITQLAILLSKFGITIF